MKVYFDCSCVYVSLCVWTHVCGLVYVYVRVYVSTGGCGGYGDKKEEPDLL